MSEPAYKLQTPPFRERRGVPAAPPKRIGHIVSVAGPKAVAVLEKTGAQAPDHTRVQIGALLKITTPASSVVGLVTAVTTPMPGGPDEEEQLGLIELNLAGEVVIAGPDRRLTFKR
ncbi:MAG: hypothetical protein JOZ93_17825, partial [Sinobacteraceae bacterium]|nr:hypothetical protein [Nevskiaceae bacterium]